MKNLKIIAIAICLTVFSGTIQAQRTEPQKKDNLITIIGSKSPQKNLISFGRYLVDNGYSIASVDKDFLVMKTDYKHFSNKWEYSTWIYKFVITFKDSLILVRPKCQVKIPNATGYWTAWHYTRNRMTFYGMVYKKFEAILKGYNGTIYFSKEDLK